MRGAKSDLAPPLAHVEREVAQDPADRNAEVLSLDHRLDVAVEIARVFVAALKKRRLGGGVEMLAKKTRIGEDGEVRLAFRERVPARIHQLPKAFSASSSES